MFYGMPASPCPLRAKYTGHADVRPTIPKLHQAQRLNGFAPVTIAGKSFALDEFQGLSLKSLPTVRFGQITSAPCQVIADNDSSIKKASMGVIGVDLNEIDTLLKSPALKEFHPMTATMLEAIREELRPGKPLPVKLTAVSDFPIKSVVFINVGNIREATPYELEEMYKTSLSRIRNQQEDLLVMMPNSKAQSLPFIQAVSTGVLRGTYFSKYEESSSNVEPKSISLVLPNAAIKGMDRKTLDETIEKARIVAEATSRAEDWINAPYTDTLNGQEFFKVAATIARSSPQLTMDTKDSQWIEKNMPAFWAVGRANQDVDPCYLVKLTYNPPGGDPKRHIGIVAKSVMYDSGGVQDKGEAMTSYGRKDMAGGAYALAVVEALAKLQPKDVKVTLYLPITANLTGPNAYLPGDLIKTKFGLGIHVEHVDAEGRLTMIEPMHKLATEDQPDEILSIAALTGAPRNFFGLGELVVTGPEPQGKVAQRLFSASETTGEPYNWVNFRKKDFRLVASDRNGADITNFVPRERGTMQGAAFVMSGLPKGNTTPWTHWDIWNAASSRQQYADSVGVRTLLEYVAG